MWLAFFLFFSCPVYAENFGNLSIFAASSAPDSSVSVKSKVQLLLVDPYGRQTGYDPAIKKRVVKIPKSGYSVEFLNDNDTGMPGPENIQLEVIGASAGKYSLLIYAIDDTEYSYDMRGFTFDGEEYFQQSVSGYASSGSIVSSSFSFDPIMGASVTVISKLVTFSLLREDVLIAYRLEHIGSKKFADSLAESISLMEKLSLLCDKHKVSKSKGCEPAAAALRLFVNRLELANRKCDAAGGCDEGPALAAFEKVHRGDSDYDDFFRAWDKDDWHKWKKTSKRFVTDEALSIIRGDAEALIKTLEPSLKGPGKR